MKKKQTKLSSRHSIMYSKGWIAGFESRSIDILLAIRDTRTRKELVKELIRTYNPKA